MKTKIHTITTIVLILGAAALFGLPNIYRPETMFIFRLGLGAVIFFASIFIAVILQSINLGKWLQWNVIQSMLKEKEVEYENAHRQFIRRLDHEMKNPLTGLQVTLTNLQEATSDKERKQAEANAIRAVKRIHNLLHNLRKLSELNAQAVENRPIDLPKLVDEMVSAIKMLPAYTKREVNVWISQVPSPFPTVYGDRDLLGLAIYNLLDNAFKFTCAEDVVEIRVREDSRKIFIEIADNGPGISSSDQQFIFDELYRGINAHGHEGSGLGLALVKRIIELHNGSVTVQSDQDESHATVFSIKIPIGVTVAPIS